MPHLNKPSARLASVALWLLAVSRLIGDAEDKDRQAKQYLEAWLEIESGFELAKDNPETARENFQGAEELLLDIRRTRPEWEPALISARLHDCEAKLLDLSANNTLNKSSEKVDSKATCANACSDMKTGLKLVKENPLKAREELMAAKELLLSIRKTNPDWEKSTVMSQLEDCEKQLRELEVQMATVTGDVQSQYLTAWLVIQKGFHLARDSPMEARQAFLEAQEVLLNIQKVRPDWAPPMVASRIDECEVQIASLK